uniref:Reverse transcriptase/retrotransposon-derived protein RNase H-like domain-containing protein n=1 Tax=Lactuca sativa TaxID=4236 RepID=A0A9R1X1Y0_LACSA|nr:hypothetical protein LSAT_V11C700351640 [Lactuca sativa]
MYLAASAEAISSMLVVERENKQTPIHFVSRALQGPEVNYTAFEKLVLALVDAEKSRRLAEWDIELGEHDIQYHPRTSIKSQDLVEFLVEILNTIKGVPTTISTNPLEPKTSKELCKLYTDGAASKEGSGATLVLQSPNGEEITYALWFDFQVSNNEPEYEALVAGLRLAKENARVDALRKLSSTSYDHLTKKVLVEVIPERSIDNEKVHTVSTVPEWTKPYVDYLRQGVPPDDPEEARKVKIRASHFTIRDNQLCRRAYLSPWLKCISKEEGHTFLEESHSRDATAHEGTHRQNTPPRGILFRRVQRRCNLTKK